MERELTVERIREGIAKAKKYGTKMGRPIGRPPRLIPLAFKKYYPMWKGGEITATSFARLLEVNRPTLYRYIKEHEAGMSWAAGNINYKFERSFSTKPQCSPLSTYVRFKYND